MTTRQQRSTKRGRRFRVAPVALGRSCQRCGADAWYTPPLKPGQKKQYPSCNPCALRRSNATHFLNRETLSPAEKLWRSAKYRAARQGVDFTITPDDIVIGDRCPVLGIEYTRSGRIKAQDSSASLDRVNPEKGYTPENTRVISTRANRIKNNGTYAEHLTIAAWMRKELGE